MLDVNNEMFIVSVAIKKWEEMPMHFKRQAQIEAQSGAHVKALLFDKALTGVPAEYSDYINIFSVENVTKLPENPGMNEYTIKLEENKQPLFGPIYSLGLVELEMLKTYMETNLAYNFIRPLKSPADILILFD